MQYCSLLTVQNLTIIAVLLVLVYVDIYIYI